MSQHAPLLPILIPFVAALWQLLVRLPGQRRIGRGACLLGVLAGIWLLSLADEGNVRLYALGDWPPPFGIVLVVDRLAALMILLTALLAGVCLHYACAGSDAHGRHFHPLFQLQLVGLYGAFLTGDLFNLFVFFEIMLLASYALLALGGGLPRTRAGMVYVVINLLGSSLFLMALGTLYGALGTLNLADVAWRIAQPGHADTLTRLALSLLVAVFVLKAALLPLSFWLPQTYAAAPPPVAALFAIMTKVGIVALLRVQIVAIAPNYPDLTADWLPVLALLTIAFAVLGSLAASSLRSLSAWLVLFSAGTLLLVPSIGTLEGSAAGIYYLTHSTFVGAAFFLLADRVGECRGSTLCAIRSAPLRAYAWQGLVFLALAVAVAGLPPFSGFVGKILLLSSVTESRLSAGLGVGVWATLLIGSFFVALALARAGSFLFWQGAPQHSGRPLLRTLLEPQALALLSLLAVMPLLVMLAQPVIAYAERTAKQLHDVEAYIHEVLGPQPASIPRAPRTAHFPVPQNQGAQP